MKKRLLLIITLLLMYSSLFAQKSIIIPIWENKISDSNKPTRNDTAKDHSIPLSEALLYVFPAKKPNGTAIICCPGGGYSHLAMEHEGTDMAEWFNDLGITFAVLKYRMPNGHKYIPLNDARQAMHIMYQHATEWNINTNKIGIMGASAGGHLAASLANLPNDNERPVFQILLYPVITMDQYTHKGSKENLLGKYPSAEDIKAFSMEQQVSNITPSAFIILSSDDHTVNPLNSISYVKALNKAKIPTSLHMYPTGGHGWGFRDSFTYKKQWTNELEKWLKTMIF